MPRIPERELERLKKEVSLVRLVESQGHTLQKRGTDWVMRCIFHEEDTPSLSISESKNLFHCFGCGAAWSVIDWVMKTQGVSLPHAVQILKDGAPSSINAAEHVGASLPVKRSTKRPLAAALPTLAATVTTAAADDKQSSANEQSPAVAQATGQALLHQVVDYYHATLKQSPDALAYLQARGLNHPELIDHFQLGYGNKTLTYRLPAGHTVAGKAMRGQLQTLGIFRQSGHEHLNGCLVVPVIGMIDAALTQHAGQIVQLYGRRITTGYRLPANEPRHLYLPRPLAGVWNEAALMASQEIILCESLLDAMTFWCAGFRNVIAAYGINGFTVDHWQALKHHATRRILIAYDRDEAGNAAAAKLAPELQEAGMEVWRVLFPKGMDANDYAQKVQPAPKSLEILLQQAQWLGKGRGPAVQGTAMAAAAALPRWRFRGAVAPHPAGRCAPGWAER